MNRRKFLSCLAGLAGAKALKPLAPLVSLAPATFLVQYLNGGEWADSYWTNKVPVEEGDPNLPLPERVSTDLALEALNKARIHFPEHEYRVWPHPHSRYA